MHAAIKRLNESLLKAKDTSKLTKKVITNKKGFRQTVYVGKNETPEEKTSILETIMKFFGFKTKAEIAPCIAEVYDQKIHGTITIDKQDFGRHFIEYFKHKDRWDSKFRGDKEKKGSNRGKLVSKTLENKTVHSVKSGTGICQASCRLSILC